MVDWSGAVREQASYSVFVVRLDDVLTRVGRPRVEYLKVDAQGYDLEVVKSAGEFIRAVDKIKMESKAEGAPGFYVGQPAPSEVEAYMKGFGFTLVEQKHACCKEKWLEVDLYFTNNDRSFHIPSDCPLGEKCRLTLDKHQ